MQTTPRAQEGCSVEIKATSELSPFLMLAFLCTLQLWLRPNSSPIKSLCLLVALTRCSSQGTSPGSKGLRTTSVLVKKH